MHVVETGCSRWLSGCARGGDRVLGAGACGGDSVPALCAGCVL